eukprot:534408-Pyramimonas_sp.AAC.1
MANRQNRARTTRSTTRRRKDTTAHGPRGRQSTIEKPTLFHGPKARPAGYAAFGGRGCLPESQHLTARFETLVPSQARIAPSRPKPLMLSIRA